MGVSKSNLPLASFLVNFSLISSPSQLLLFLRVAPDAPDLFGVVCHRSRAAGALPRKPAVALSKAITEPGPAPRSQDSIDLPISGRALGPAALASARFTH